MTRRQLISYAFIALLIFVAIQFSIIFSPFLESILWASLLCFGFYPLYSAMSKHFPGRSNVCALISTLLVFLLVFPPILILLFNLASEAVDLYQSISDYVRTGRLEELINRIRGWQPIQNAVVHVQRWEPLKTRLAEWMLTSSKAVANFSVAQAGKLTTNIIFLALNLFVTFFMLFFFFRDGRRILDFIYQIIPLEESTKQLLFKQINGTLSAVIRGQILTSLIQSLIAGILFKCLGVPGAILFGIATFFTSLIPVLGTYSIWLPIAVYLWATGHVTQAIILVVFGIGVIGMIDNVLKPIFIGEKTKLPYFLLFFGIMGGLKVYGIKGVIFAPVVLSLFFALVKIYREKFLLHNLSDSLPPE